MLGRKSCCLPGRRTWVYPARVRLTLTYSALKTPQLLELSGIGRKDVLEKIGVPLKIELPGVGENVQEHYLVGSSWGALHRPILCANTNIIAWIELKDDVPYDTLDLLHDPAIAAKHLELQYATVILSQAQPINPFSVVK